MSCNAIGGLLASLVALKLLVIPCCFPFGVSQLGLSDWTMISINFYSSSSINVSLNVIFVNLHCIVESAVLPCSCARFSVRRKISRRARWTDGLTFGCDRVFHMSCPECACCSVHCIVLSHVESARSFTRIQSVALHSCFVVPTPTFFSAMLEWIQAQSRSSTIYLHDRIFAPHSRFPYSPNAVFCRDDAWDHRFAAQARHARVPRAATVDLWQWSWGMTSL